LPDIAADTLVSLNEKLSSQILGSLDFFKNTESFTRGFSKIYVTGGGSLAPGLTKNLSRTLGAGVEYLNALKKISVPSKILKSSSEVMLQYTSAVAIGLSLREIQKS
jgi:Tfp pilus assembly PilM family ATPase